MFKRLFWLTVGAIAGVSASFWARRRVRLLLEPYKPEQIAQRVTTTAHSLGDQVRTAARQGREAMHEREAALRDRFPG